LIWIANYFADGRKLVSHNLLNDNGVASEVTIFYNCSNLLSNLSVLATFKALLLIEVIAKYLDGGLEERIKKLGSLLHLCCFKSESPRFCNSNFDEWMTFDDYLLSIIKQLFSVLQA